MNRLSIVRPNTPNELRAKRATRWGVRTTGTWVSLLVVGAFAIACSNLQLDSFSESEFTANSCEDDSVCGAGRCKSGICEASSSALGPLLFEISPPVGTPLIGGIGFTQIVEPSAFVANSEFRLRIEHVSEVSATVTSPVFDRSSCVSVAQDEKPGPTEGQPPARVTFIPRERLLGLPNPSYSGEFEGGLSDVLDVVMPPGGYDVYVEPLTGSGNCVFPPYLVLDVEVTPGKVKMLLEPPAPEALSLSVRFPQSAGDLSKWEADIVERTSGRALSNRRVLGEPEVVDGALEYTVGFAFSQVSDQEGADSELVRLTPPETEDAPTIYVERSVVELFQGGRGVIDQLTDLPETIDFSLRVTEEAGAEPVQAMVQLVALEIFSTEPGTLAEFSRTVDTNEDGFVETKLLPGEYLIRAVPSSDEFSASETTIRLDDEAKTQTGRIVEVSRRALVSGTVKSFAGDRVVGATVGGRFARREETPSILGIAQGFPRVSEVITESSGAFTLHAEPGSFHFQVRPAPDSNFPWAFVSQRAVDGDLDLGDVTLSLPLVIPGRLVSENIGGDLENTLIRIHAFLGEGEFVSDPENADGLVQIGEARTDLDGRFRLLLPSEFK